MVSDTIDSLSIDRKSSHAISYQEISDVLNDYIQCYSDYAGLAQNLLDQDVL